MSSRYSLLVVGLILVLGALMVVSLGLRRVTVWILGSPKVVWQSRFGPGGVGQAVGLDGRLYGPLAFAVGRTGLAVADTYNTRVMLIGHSTKIIGTPGMMIEDIAVTPSGGVLAADNQTGTVWRLGNGPSKVLIHFPQKPGYTESIWHLVTGPNGMIFVEFVRFGHGGFSVYLNEYTKNGTFIRNLSTMQSDPSNPLKPLSTGFVRSFQVSPNGRVYVEPPSSSPNRRLIRVYSESGKLSGELYITSPVKIEQSDLLGVNAQGTIYFGVNLTVPHRARVLVVTKNGHLLADLAAHSIPFYSASYGRVGPRGSLYLNQSTRSSYRIVKWPMLPQERWRWKG